MEQLPDPRRKHLLWALLLTVLATAVIALWPTGKPRQTAVFPEAIPGASQEAKRLAETRDPSSTSVPRVDSADEQPVEPNRAQVQKQRPADRLEVLVVDELDRPLDGVVVCIAPSFTGQTPAERNVVRRATTGPTGVAVFDCEALVPWLFPAGPDLGVPEEFLGFAAIHQVFPEEILSFPTEHAMSSAIVSADLRNARHDRLRLVLPSRSGLLVRVRDEATGPLDGAIVSLYPAPQPVGTRTSGEKLTTARFPELESRNGVVRFERVPRGTDLVLVVRGPWPRGELHRPLTTGSGSGSDEIEVVFAATDTVLFGEFGDFDSKTDRMTWSPVRPGRSQTILWWSFQRLPLCVDAQRRFALRLAPFHRETLRESDLLAIRSEHVVTHLLALDDVLRPGTFDIGRLDAPRVLVAGDVVLPEGAKLRSLTVAIGRSGAPDDSFASSGVNQLGSLVTVDSAGKFEMRLEAPEGIEFLAEDPDWRGPLRIVGSRRLTPSRFDHELTLAVEDDVAPPIAGHLRLSPSLAGSKDLPKLLQVVGLDAEGKELIRGSLVPSGDFTFFRADPRIVSVAVRTPWHGRTLAHATVQPDVAITLDLGHLRLERFELDVGPVPPHEIFVTDADEAAGNWMELDPQLSDFNLAFDREEHDLLFQATHRTELRRNGVRNGCRIELAVGGIPIELQLAHIPQLPSNVHLLAWAARSPAGGRVRLGVFDATGLCKGQVPGEGRWYVKISLATTSLNHSSLGLPFPLKDPPEIWVQPSERNELVQSFRLAVAREIFAQHY